MSDRLIPLQNVGILEDLVSECAEDLSTAEEALAQEYLRLVAAGTPTWQAQKQAELGYGRAVNAARAGYEIALVRLKTGSTAP